MIYLLDGSNILGHLRRDRTSSVAKRELVQAASSLARSTKAKVICIFDGAMEEPFGTRLGSVTVRFAGPRSADDLIVEEVRGVSHEPVRVISSDAELAARVRGRGVEVMAAGMLAQLLESDEQSGTALDEDWSRYFSDPKNRNV